MTVADTTDLAAPDSDFPSLEDLARDVCYLAQRGGMPDTYWLRDSRIARACLVLGISPEAARDTDWLAPVSAAEPNEPTPAADADPLRESAADPVAVPDVDPDFGDVPVASPTPVIAGVDPTGPTEVWTDGACRHNPGPGGWGWITPDGRQDSGALAGTTNNVMEITAALEAVKSIPERPLVVVSDSRYVVDCFEKQWWRGWLKRGWKASTGKDVANQALWSEFIDLVVFGGVTHAENPDRKVVDTGITFRWVKGHANWPLNEAADRLAVAARETLPDQSNPRRSRGGRGR